MAAERVVRENLERTLLLTSEEAFDTLLPLKEAFDTLRNLVRDAGGAMVEREELGNLVTSHDQPESSDIQRSIMRKRLEILSNLIHEADDLLDQILTFAQRTRIWRGQRGGNGSEPQNDLVRQVIHVMARFTQEVRLIVSSSSQPVFPEKVKKISIEIKHALSQLLIESDNPNLDVERKFQHTKWAITAEQRVIGRENDKEKIVNMLLQPPV